MTSSFLFRWFWLPFVVLTMFAINQPPVGDINAGPTPLVVDQQIIATYRSGSVTLTGTGLGDAASSRTLLIESGVQSVALSSESPLVQDWRDDLVEFSLPSELQSGNLTVVVDGVASEPVELLVFGYESVDLPQTLGTDESALALAMSSDGALWINQEFHLELKAIIPGSPRNAIAVTVPQAAGPGIFAQSFLGDTSTPISMLGEDIAVDGDGNVWFTQGGGYLYGGSHPNISRLIRFDRAAGTFACFNIPNDDAEIMGVLIDERRQMVWYSEGGLTKGNAIAGIALDSTLSDCFFDPHSSDLRDPLCPDSAGLDCHWRFPLPQPRSAPAHLALDADGDIWFTEFWGNRIGRLTPETGEIIELPLPPPIVRAGPGIYVDSGPWELAFDDNGYLWVSEFFDATLLRINPSLMASADCEYLDAAGQNPCIEEIVVASDGFDGKTMHSLAVSAEGRVWFAVSEIGADGNRAQIGFIAPMRGDEAVFLPENPGFRRVTGMVADPHNSGLWFLENGEGQAGHLTQLDPVEEDGVPDGAIGCDPAGEIANVNELYGGCVVDSDGDGCTDVAELGSDPYIGGLRDPSNYWDFYDMPTMNGTRDADITLLTDILAVVRRIGTDDAGGAAIVNRYSDPMAPPEDMVSYHPAFDRSPPPPGENRYALGPPDGRIDLWDLLGVILQYGHSC